MHRTHFHELSSDWKHSKLMTSVYNDPICRQTRIFERRPTIKDLRGEIITSSTELPKIIRGALFFKMTQQIKREFGMKWRVHCSLPAAKELNNPEVCLLIWCHQRMQIFGPLYPTRKFPIRPLSRNPEI